MASHAPAAPLPIPLIWENRHTAVPAQTGIRLGAYGPKTGSVGILPVPGRAGSPSYRAKGLERGAGVRTTGLPAGELLPGPLPTLGGGWGGFLEQLLYFAKKIFHPHPSPPPSRGRVFQAHGLLIQKIRLPYDQITRDEGKPWWHRRPACAGARLEPRGYIFFQMKRCLQEPYRTLLPFQGIAQWAFHDKLTQFPRRTGA